MDLLLTGLLMHPVALIVIMIMAVLIFGKRLPEIARSLGKGIAEFKEGVKGIENEMERPLPPRHEPYPQIQYQPNAHGQQVSQHGAPPAYQPPAGQYFSHEQALTAGPIGPEQGAPSPEVEKPA